MKIDEISSNIVIGCGSCFLIALVILLFVIPKAIFIFIKIIMFILFVFILGAIVKRILLKIFSDKYKKDQE